jgi:capsular exopolysaccharide synthesis family protein
MERIRKALEQAEIDRQKAGISKKASAPESSAAAVEAVGEAKPSVEKAMARAVEAQTRPPLSTQRTELNPDQADITYTRTRCIDVSTKTYIDNHIVAALPGHELQDTYRMLRTRIMREMSKNGWNMIMVTGAHQGAGKSMTAVNLAVAMSFDVNTTVLLVDADLRQPSLHTYFGYTPELGFSDYLLHDAPIEDLLFHPNGLDRLVVLPGRERIENSAEMLSSPRTARLAEELKTRYKNRIIIVDAPPVLSSDDVVVTDKYVDAVLLVAEAGVTKRQELQDSLRVLSNVPVLGTVLNKAPNSPSKTRY